MVRNLTIIILMIMVVIFVGCSTHIHTIGDGASGNDKDVKRQWYVAFGLATLNEVDTREMAGEAENYEIKTQTTFIDGLIGVLTYSLISPRTVTVTK